MLEIIEVVINFIFFGIFIVLAIMSFRLSLGIRKKLRRSGRGCVVILNVDWKSAIEDNYKLGLSTAVATSVSALIFSYYFILIILILIYLYFPV